jgi:pimeloyl-ACP methyl ester carboxylesterase
VTHHPEPRPLTFAGAAGNRLVADVFGRHGPAVLLLHGGGQTRHAWRDSAQKIARAGMTAYALDQRGHGDSDWVAGGAYRFFDFADDVRAVTEKLCADAGPPVVIGASLGGISALLAYGARPESPIFSALVLVDITPRVDLSGVEKIQGFMREHALEGFASLEEAASVVAAYLPHRPRPRSNEGLKKNLRLHPDGRWRWHWDPLFLAGRSPVSGDRIRVEEALVAAARRLVIPTLLVRGGSSELVHEVHVKEFLELAPHAGYADVSGARHMVAGDQNDQFSNAILHFLENLEGKGLKA